jgi:small conductance mechanosensitive channel
MMRFDVSPAWSKIHALGNSFLALLPNLVIGLVVLAVLWFLARWIKTIVISFYNRGGRHPNLGLVLGRLVQAILMLVSVMIALSIVLPSFNAKDIIQVLGIGSVAIGFAFRDVLQNFLAGILILLAEPFKIGEEISVGNVTGYVREVQTRATLIRTSDGYLVVIPNSCIYTDTVTILNAYEWRRTGIEFLIGLREDLNAARSLVVEAMANTEGVLTKPAPSAVYTGFGPSGVMLKARFWTGSNETANDDVGVRDRLIPAIVQKLMEHGIDIAYPTQQLLLHDQTEESNGDRKQQRAGWPARDAETTRPKRIVDALEPVLDSQQSTHRQPDH